MDSSAHQKDCFVHGVYLALAPNVSNTFKTVFALRIMNLKPVFAAGILLFALLDLCRANPVDDGPPFVVCVRPGNLAASTFIKTNVLIHLKQYIWVDVEGNLSQWLSSTNDRASVVPCFDGIALRGIFPENPNVPADTNFFDDGSKVYHFRFFLSRDTDDTKSAWKSLLNHPVHTKQLTVTLANASGEQLSTSVDIGSITGYRYTPAFLVVIPTFIGIISLVIIMMALGLFFALAKSTDILRDTTSPKRPDDAPCFSLARTQMAFWFFLVLTSFLLLWLVTGDVDTITASVLGLIGISAGTALGSAVIDAAKTAESDISKQVVRSDLLGKPAKEIVIALKADREQLKSTLVGLQTQRSALPMTNQAVIDANSDQQRDIRDRLANINWQISFFSMKPWKVVMYDLLGDKESISFHRFQIFVWTIVLGFIFVIQVNNDLTMPEFSGTLLGLMGISAGTFIGFKLPDQKSASSS